MLQWDQQKYLDTIDPLISKVERFGLIGDLFIQRFIDQLLNRMVVHRRTKLFVCQLTIIVVTRNGVGHLTNIQ